MSRKINTNEETDVARTYQKDGWELTVQELSFSHPEDKNRKKENQN
jgi:hypothetical protein